MKEHSQRLPIFIQITGVFIILSTFYFSYYIYSTTKESEVLLVLIPSLLIIVIFIAPFLVIFQRISISKETITLTYFPIFRKKIPFAEIKEVKFINNFSCFRDAGGIGLRKAPGKLALANTSGTAIEIFTEESSYVYSFGNDDKLAEDLLNEIKKRIELI